MPAQGPTHTAQVKQYHASYLSLAFATIDTISLFLCIVLTRVHSVLRGCQTQATFSLADNLDTHQLCNTKSPCRKTIIQTEYGNATKGSRRGHRYSLCSSGTSRAIITIPKSRSIPNYEISIYIYIYMLGLSGPY